MKSARCRRNVKLDKSVIPSMLAVLLLSVSVSTQITGPFDHRYRSVSRTSIYCSESALPEDARGRFGRSRKALVDNIRCRESLQNPTGANSAVNRQLTGRVNVTEIGPVGGGSFSKAGFIFNGEDTKQILLPGSRIFRSVNGGHDWFPITPISIAGVAETPGVVRQDPQNSQVLLATIADGLVYRSDNFGTTWTPLEASSNFLAVDFAFNEASSNVILFLDSRDGIWSSNDGGSTVEYQPNTGLPAPQFDPDLFEPIAVPEYTNIATTPADPDIVYVVMNNDQFGYYAPGIFKSIDGGQTFARLEGSWSSPDQVFLHPTNPNVLYVKDVVGSDVLPKIFRSIDGGASFNLITTGLPADLFVTFVAFDVHNPSSVYLTGATGFFRSTDNGTSFQRLGLTAEQVGVGTWTASVDPTSRRVLYVNTSRGNFKSANGGQTFESISNGWRSAFVNDMTFDKDSEPGLYIAAQEGLGILRTRTRGKHYEQIPHPVDPFDPLARVRRLEISPTNPDVVFAGTLGRGLFRTTNGGKSWTQSSVDTGHDQFHQNLTQIAVDPINPTNVYFATSRGLLSLGFPGFYRSSDSGSTFRRTSLEALDKLAIDPFNPNVIYAGSRLLNFGPRKSVDGGFSFSNGPIRFASVSTIMIDPNNPNNLYLAGVFQLTDTFEQHWVVRSTDGGLTYSTADEGLPFVIDLVIDPQDPARLYAWTIEGLFISTDHATSWTLLEGLEPFKTAGILNKMTINPKNPNLLYLWGSSVVEVEIKSTP